MYPHFDHFDHHQICNEEGDFLFHWEIQAQNVQKCEKEKKVTNISFIFAFVLYS
jgi:hypothetical protein